MRGYNVNIYFSEKTYNKIKPLIEKRKVSQFVNKLVERELEKEQKKSRKELRKKMIEGYKRNSSNKRLQKELKAIEETSIEDVLTILEKREQKMAGCYNNNE